MKQTCAFGKCRRKAHDVKNSSYTLQREQVNVELCRPLRRHCGTIKFCCASHMNRSKVAPTKKKAQGREALDASQTALLFHTLKDLGFVWAAVMLLCQLYFGERADAIRKVQAGWFKHLNPAAAGTPSVVVPEGVNGKTWSREISLPIKFAHVLHEWMEVKPLTGGKNHQWPFQHQKLDTGTNFLFPGVDTKSQTRTDKAVSEKAFFNCLRKASKILTHARKIARDRGETHPFEGVNLENVATHTLKKTHVTMMKCNGFSAALIASITGTSSETLDKHYDVPTGKRQRQALETVFGPVLTGCQNPTVEEEKQTFCSRCGMATMDSWNYCCKCGTQVVRIQRQFGAQQSQA